MGDTTILDIIIRGKDELTSAATKASDSMSGMQKATLKAAEYGTAALIGLGVASVKMAADYQESMTQLVTGAGESRKNLAMVSAGILQMSVATDESTKELSSGMYLVESAGFHGAAGLTVLKAAAEGANIGNAQLSVVADGLTTVLHDYHLPASKAVAVTNEMVTAVAQGKMHMQDFASSLSAVLPIAQTVGLSFAQVAGAEATLTAGGVSAQQASQDLHAVISSLQAPTLAQTKAMEQYGINTVQLAKNMGKNGLSGTLQILTNAILKNMKGGLVVQNAMQNATVATQDFNIEMAHSPAALRTLATELQNGTISFANFRSEVQMLPPGMANMGKQMEATYDKTKSFNSLLTAGNPAAQTYAAALKTVTGQSNAMNAVEMLTGANQKTFNTNVKAISASYVHAGTNAKGWNLITKDTNFQIGQVSKAVEALMIGLGTALLPAVNAVAKALTAFIKPIATFIEKNKTLSAVIFGTATAFLGMVTGILLLEKNIKRVKEIYTGFKTALSATGEIGKAVRAVKEFGNSLLSLSKALLQNIANGARWLLSMAKQTVMLIVNTGKTIASTAAQWASSIASKAAAAGQWLWNAAMDANPIGLLIIAIAALIAIVVLVVLHWKAVASFFTRLWGDLMSLFRSKIGFIIAAILPFIGIPLLIAAHWQTVSAFFVRLWGEVVNGLSHFVSSVVNFFEQLPGKILKALGNFGNLLYNAGRDIVQGLTRGITDFASTAVNAVKNVGSNVVKGFKNLLGIHSPSTVFAEAGKNIGLGLMQGIQGTAAGVKQAVNGLVSTTINPQITGSTVSAPGTTAAQNGTASASAPASGGSTFNAGGITVNIGMYAGSQTEKQQIATEIWQALMQVARSHNLSGNVPNFGIASV